MLEQIRHHTHRLVQGLADELSRAGAVLHNHGPRPPHAPAPFTLSLSLSKAASEGKARLERMLTRADRRASDAVMAGDLNDLRHALRRGAGINHIDPRTGNTLLTTAVLMHTRGMGAEIVEYLLAANDTKLRRADPGKRNHWGQTSLHIAASFNNAAALSLMLNRPAALPSQAGGQPDEPPNLDLPDRSGRSTMQIAAANADPETIEVLRGKGRHVPIAPNAHAAETGAGQGLRIPVESC